MVTRKNTRVDFMEQNYLLPTTKEGIPDQRFQESLGRVVEEAGEETLQELWKFMQVTASTQQGASQAGLRLAVAIFNEASYLDKHHRYDADNKYGYKSKVLRSQAQQILENIGFKKTNANKIVAVASFLACNHHLKHLSKWYASLTVSHLYEISRMSDEGLRHVMVEVSYEGFNFMAGQQDISVRRLEEIRRRFPKRQPDKDPGDAVFGKQKDDDCTKLSPCAGASKLSAKEKIEQFTGLLGQISWDDVSSDNELVEMLRPWRGILEGVSNIAQ